MNQEQQLKNDLAMQDAEIRALQEQFANISRLLVIAGAGRVAILREIESLIESPTP